MLVAGLSVKLEIKSGKECFFEICNSYELLVAILFCGSVPAKRCSLIIRGDISDEQASELSRVLNVRVIRINEGGFFSRFVKNLSIIRSFLLNPTVFYSFHEITLLGLFRYFRLDFVLLEHGLINYKDIFNLYSKYSKYGFFKRVLRERYVGQSGSVKKVYLRNALWASDVLIDKVESLDLVDLYNSVSNDVRDLLFWIFDFDEKLSGGRGRSLIVTQPFSELSIISEEKKINIYERLIDSYAEGDVYIKPHPVETTKYSDFFKDVSVLRKDVPYELYELSGFSFDRIITVDSSVALHSKCDCIEVGRGIVYE